MTGSRLKSDGRRARSVAMITQRPVMGSFLSSGNFDENLFSAGIPACTSICCRKARRPTLPATRYYSVRLGRKASRKNLISGGDVNKMLTMSNRTAPQSTPERLA